MEFHWGWKMFASRSKVEDLCKNTILPITRCYKVNENICIIYWYKEFIPLIVTAKGDFNIGNIKRILTILSCDRGQGALISCLNILFLESDKESSKVIG